MHWLKGSTWNHSGFSSYLRFSIKCLFYFQNEQLLVKTPKFSIHFSHLFPRTTGLTCFCGKNGTTPAWLTENTPTTLLIWTPPCWIPSGNQIYSSQMRKEPISMRSPQITSCCGFFKMAAFCTASGT